MLFSRLQSGVDDITEALSVFGVPATKNATENTVIVTPGSMVGSILSAMTIGTGNTTGLLFIRIIPETVTVTVGVTAGIAPMFDTTISIITDDGIGPSLARVVTTRSAHGGGNLEEGAQQR